MKYFNTPELYNDTDCKPIGNISKDELIKLEHKYRLLLKKSGYSDIEEWENNHDTKIKVIRFIKGHVRYKGKDATRYWSEAIEKSEFFRVIGLYANHCKECKYVETLKDYAMTGNMCESIRNTKSLRSQQTLSAYVINNFSKMLEFVNNMNGE